MPTLERAIDLAAAGFPEPVMEAPTPERSAPLLISGLWIPAIAPSPIGGDRLRLRRRRVTIQTACVSAGEGQPSPGQSARPSPAVDGAHGAAHEKRERPMRNAPFCFVQCCAVRLPGGDCDVYRSKFSFISSTVVL